MTKTESKFETFIKTTKGKVTVTSVTLLVIALAVFGVSQMVTPKQPVVTFNDTKLVFEYGEEEIDIEKLVESIVDTEESNFDTLDTKETEFKTDEVGEFTTIIKATLKKETVDFEVDYKVEDTEKPTLTGVKDLEFEEGSEFKHNIKAEDKVDGDLKVEIIGDYDMKKPGEYKLEAVTKDKNGNETKESFKLTVTAKPEPEPEKPVTPPANNNSGNTNNSGNNKPSGGNGNGGTANKPSGGSGTNKPSGGGGNTSTPKPTPKPEPKPQLTPPRPLNQFVNGGVTQAHPFDYVTHDGYNRYFYAEYATPEACRLQASNTTFLNGWVLDNGFTGTTCLDGELFIH